MDNKLSFIPKKTFTAPAYKAGGPGVILVLSFVLFLVSALLFGGLLLYKNNVSQQVDVLSQSLERAKGAFEPSAVNTLISMSERIKVSEELISQHKTLVPFFDFLEENTLEDIAFDQFGYSEEGDESVLFSMDGESRSYSLLAMQADIFKKNENIQSVSFSNLKLGVKGVINFSVMLSVNPSLLIYNVE